MNDQPSPEGIETDASEHPSESLSFTDFGLDPTLEQNLDAAGYEQPRPIQAGTIAPALDGRDVLGLAQTGTGKTCAFAVPIIQALGHQKRGKRPRALVIAPTRERPATRFARLP